MREHRVSIRKPGEGRLPNSHLRRVVMYLELSAFEKLQDRARALEIGNGSVARRIVKAYLFDEPRPILLGVEERS